jgi:hypothetical protein
VPSGTRGRLPVLVFTQWVSCGSIEHNAQSPWRRAVADFVRAQGLAFVRVERASDGDSEGPACHKLDYDTEVRHYIATFDALLSSNPRLDPSRVFVLGQAWEHDGRWSRLRCRNGRQCECRAGRRHGHLFQRMMGFERFYLERRRGRATTRIHDQMMKRIHFLHAYLI